MPKNFWEQAELYHMRESLGKSWGVSRGDSSRLHNSEYFKDYYESKSDFTDSAYSPFETVMERVEAQQFDREVEKARKNKPKLLRRVIRKGEVIQEVFEENSDISTAR